MHATTRPHHTQTHTQHKTSVITPSFPPGQPSAQLGPYICITLSCEGTKQDGGDAKNDSVLPAQLKRQMACPHFLRLPTHGFEHQQE